MVCTWTDIVTIHPGTGDQTYKILIPVKVLGKNNKMITTSVTISGNHVFFIVTGHIHLTPKDGFERLQPLFLTLAVDFACVIKEFFNAKHIAMVCYGHSPHAIAYSLVDKLGNLRHSV